MTCGPKPASWDIFFTCVNTAIAGNCADECADPCFSCLTTECASEYDACQQDPVCDCNITCLLSGGNENMCANMCGAFGMTIGALFECFDTAEGAGGPCEQICI